MCGNIKIKLKDNLKINDLKIQPITELLIEKGSEHKIHNTNGDGNPVVL